MLWSVSHPGCLSVDSVVSSYGSWVIELLPALSLSWMDPDQLIRAFGAYAVWGVAFIVFAECGLFAILPGDSLLFTVGLFVAVGAVATQLWIVCLVLTVAAILGNATGYALGRLIGPPLLRPRPGLLGRILHPAHVTRTRSFLDRYGRRALVLARFVPVVRTFVTLVAGVSQMPFRRFIGPTPSAECCGRAVSSCSGTSSAASAGSTPTSTWFW